MNASAFRHLYDYHFSENRKLWDEYIPTLSQEQFTADVSYSHGSVRNQIVHLISVDDTWFSALRGLEVPETLDPLKLVDRRLIRAHWDMLEQHMPRLSVPLARRYAIRKTIPRGEDKDLLLWQVLLHVVNHGTDHRAQLLRLLNDFGIKTVSQDYIFYVYEHL